jgi:hypothetical protein
MKRRLFLLLGASTMTVTSLAGFTTATAAPAAAAIPDPLVAIGYIIQCLTPQTILNNFAVCLVNAIEDLVASLSLPTSLGNLSTPNVAPKLPTLPGSNAPTLSLPTNVQSILKTLPPALQTNPVASAPAVNAPIKQLIPTLSPKAGASSLPKVPTITPIKFLNASDSTAASGSPISATDAAGVAVLVLMAASAVTFRRRAAAIS